MAQDTIVPVPLGSRSYEIRVVHGDPNGFGPFAKSALANSWAGLGCRRGLIITDENAAPLVKPFADALRESGIATTVSTIAPGESSKSLDQVSAIYDRLIELRADRHFAIIAIGGGVIGDLGGFVAATFVRGLPLLMIPTTLLAQVDSSVGGKVGVNHPRAKNIIGAFHQPAGVWIDTATLDTLPIRELRCGLAEVVKYGAIMDADFFAFLEYNVEAILAKSPETIQTVISQCCELKAKVVSQDEREETGFRAILNFGHTIGHAIEAVAGYGGMYQHGEAVAVGMVAECRLAERIGWIDSATTTRIANLLHQFNLPTSTVGLDSEAIVEAMTRDKKNRDGSIRFVLPRKLGHVELSDAIDAAIIRDVVASMQKGTG